MLQISVGAEAPCVEVSHLGGEKAEKDAEGRTSESVGGVFRDCPIDLFDP